MLRRLITFVLIALGLLWLQVTPCLACSPQGIQNGDFEAGMAGWIRLDGEAADAPGAGGTANSARLGPSVGIILPSGKVGSGIAQRFNCGPVGPNDDCFIKFDYRIPANPVAKAAVWIDGPSGSKLAILPFSPGFATVQVQYPDCGVLTVYFMIIEAGAVVTTDCRVDRVQNKCDVLAFAGIDNLILEDAPPNCTGDCADFSYVARLLSTQFPIPTLSPWGTIALVILLVVAARAVLRRTLLDRTWEGS